MNNEVWKDIKGYEGFYQVSTLGRVRTLPRKRVKGGIMSLENNKGYLRVTLSKNGIKKHYMVHRIVAIVFIDNPNNYQEINHIDENTKNNCVDNLEWCTHIYNINYGTRTYKSSKKQYKSVAQYDIDNNYICTYKSLHTAAISVNGDASAICNCCKGRYHTAYGYKWKYESEVMSIYE